MLNKNTRSVILRAELQTLKQKGGAASLMATIIYAINDFPTCKFFSSML